MLLIKLCLDESLVHSYSEQTRSLLGLFGSFERVEELLDALGLPRAKARLHIDRSRLMGDSPQVIVPIDPFTYIPPLLQELNETKVKLKEAEKRYNDLLAAIGNIRVAEPIMAPESPPISPAAPDTGNAPTFSPLHPRPGDRRF